MTGATCRSCGRAGLATVFDAAHVPVENSRLYPDAGSARGVPRGDLYIEQCRHCGFVQNSAFDAGLVRYDDAYVDAQGHSAVFRAFAGRIIDELIDTYGLTGARALEIGCGNGDFLLWFCERSGGSGVGLDPVLGARSRIDGDVELRAESYGLGSGAYDADVVICRHTLEHVAELAGLLRTIRTELDGSDPIVYLEVPNSGRIADEAAFWDVYYEHCSYLDQAGFAAVLRSCGFEPVVSRLDYGGQYLVVHARLADPQPIKRRSDLPDFTPLAEHVELWRVWARELSMRGGQVALWAASSKAVAFLSAVPELEPVAAVDINPAKVGQYLPGSGVEVISPAQLVGRDIDVILVMNPIYLDEIRQDLATLRIEAELIGLGD